jgi:hypothetical protein
MKIKKNVGRLDRTLRIAVGSGLLLAGLFLTKNGSWFVGIGLAILVVGLIGFCPVYFPFGISTRKQG